MIRDPETRTSRTAKRLALMICLIVASLGGGVAYYFCARPVYYARSKIRVDFPTRRAEVDRAPAENRIRAVSRELTAPHLIERTAHTLGLKGSSRDIALNHVFKTNVREVSGKELEIEVWTATAALARSWAKTLANEFRSYRQEKRVRDRNEIFEAYARATEVMRAKAAKGFSEPADSAEEQAARAKLAELNALRDLPVALARLGGRLEELGRIRMQTIEAKVPTPRAGLEGEAEQLQSEKRDLEKSLPSYADVATKAEEIKRESSLFDRTQMRWNALYQQMEQRLQALDLTNKSDHAELHVVDIADLGGKRVSPDWMKVATWSVLLGMFLGLGVPFFLEHFDRRLTQLAQLESICHIPGLGIARIARASGKPVWMNRKALSETSLTEDFRGIRDKLSSTSQSSATSRVAMVTSALPQEGKTIAAAALATAFAKAGAKTLLIDADFRSGCVNRLFGFRKSPGLAEVVRCEARLEQACRATAHPNLAVLNIGRNLEATADFAASEKFADYLKLLRGKFERIVIDAPSVLSLDEMSALPQGVDDVLLIVRSDDTQIKDLKSAIARLRENGTSCSGAILTRSNHAT